MQFLSRSIIITALLFSTTIFGCKQIDLFEKNTTIPANSWKSNFAATGSFQIQDTTHLYDLYIVLRHSDAYEFNNIWLNVGMQVPGDSMYYQKLNIKLANDAGWFGTGMNDIWEVRHKLNGFPRKFTKAGTYTFQLNQIMRQDPLPGIMSAGFRVEKAGSL